jgi:6-pyruvoyltetrahydropterin/6-carboxytetrahydropterin synthase
MGHRVSSHDGQCKNLHGHRYTAKVTILGDIPGSGMIEDFGLVKAKLSELIDALDHGFMVWKEDPDCDKLLAIGGKILVMPFIPTAENIARYILEESQKLLGHLQVVKVRVYETPNCYADASI